MVRDPKAAIPIDAPQKAPNALVPDKADANSSTKPSRLSPIAHNRILSFLIKATASAVNHQRTPDEQPAKTNAGNFPYSGSPSADTAKTKKPRVTMMTAKIPFFIFSANVEMRHDLGAA